MNAGEHQSFIERITGNHPLGLFSLAGGVEAINRVPYGGAEAAHNALLHRFGRDKKGCAALWGVRPGSVNRIIKRYQREEWFVCGYQKGRLFLSAETADRIHRIRTRGRQ